MQYNGLTSGDVACHDRPGAMPAAGRAATVPPPGGEPRGAGARPSPALPCDPAFSESDPGT